MVKQVARKIHALNGKDLGELLFRFAVIADTHINQEEGKSSSPYAVNALANARTRHVIAEINQLKPEFVIHLGDIVHPVPELPSYVPAAEQFKALTKALQPKLYIIPGNHDVGDKPVEWMPAGTVTAEFVELYRRHFGRDYFSFDSNGCHFIMINAQVINSGLKAEREQQKWLEKDFAASRDKRTFFCTHYPPYVSDRDEASSYDNIDEPGRSWLLKLIERYKPEALFAGHVHNLWYDVHAATECYILPSTAFVRHDYAELYRIEPGDEEGRNDAAKLGYFVVDVHAHGHVAHWMRTHGAMLDPGKKLPATRRLPPAHTKTNVEAPVGVDLRHPWAEVMEIAATGGMQEFARKKARNDYPVYALWEMGVRRLSVPLHDLLDPQLRARMRLLAGLGHRFTIYHFGIPDGKACTLLKQFRGSIDALQIIMSWSQMKPALPGLRALKTKTGCRIVLSKLRKHEDAKYDGSRFSHFINHGFVLAEHEQLATLMTMRGAREAVDGVSFRVVRERSPWDDIPAVRKLCAALGTAGAVQLRLAGNNPAEVLADDLATANRVAETVVAALANPGLATVFDTFVDIDRGYFARNGFFDRRYNPRVASRVYANLHSALGPVLPLKLGGDSLSVPGGQLGFFSSARTQWALLLPASRMELRRIPLDSVPAKTAQCARIDLASGVIETLGWASAGGTAAAELTRTLVCTAPALVSFSTSPQR